MSDYHVDRDWCLENPDEAARELEFQYHKVAELEGTLKIAETERDALAAHVKLLEEMRLRAQADYLLEHSDGETDCVTPYDIYGGPETSLARRDLLRQASILHKACNDGLWGADLRHLAFELEDAAGAPRMSSENHQAMGGK